MESKSDLKCKTCIFAKSYRVFYPPCLNKRESPFYLVHCDVWGPFFITTPSRIMWFVLFVDDCTRMTWLYMMKNKMKFALFFKKLIEWSRYCIHILLKCFDLIMMGNLLTQLRHSFFVQKWVLHEITCPQMPEQNDVVEIKKFPYSRNIPCPLNWWLYTLVLLGWSSYLCGLLV